MTSRSLYTIMKFLGVKEHRIQKLLVRHGIYSLDDSTTLNNKKLFEYIQMKTRHILAR